jgi:hypothetical protein
MHDHPNAPRAESAAWRLQRLLLLELVIGLPELPDRLVDLARALPARPGPLLVAARALEAAGLAHVDQAGAEVRASGAARYVERLGLLWP